MDEQKKSLKKFKKKRCSINIRNEINLNCLNEEIALILVTILYLGKLVEIRIYLTRLKQ